MKKNNRAKEVLCAIAIVLFAATPYFLEAQAGPPSLSANPGNHVIFAAKGQTPEQQAQDEADAYTWATEKTGWDPYKAKDALAGETAANKESADSAKGSAVGGAARGALLGVAIGAIAGDAGTGAAIGGAAGGITGGMRQRQAKTGASKADKAAVQDYNEKFQLWDKHFVAAMEGKGYTVK
jgi:hypothetical protein